MSSCWEVSKRRERTYIFYVGVVLICVALAKSISSSITAGPDHLIVVRLYRCVRAVHHNLFSRFISENNNNSFLCSLSYSILFKQSYSFTWHSWLLIPHSVLVRIIHPFRPILLIQTNIFKCRLFSGYHIYNYIQTDLWIVVIHQAFKHICNILCSWHRWECLLLTCIEKQYA